MFIYMVDANRRRRRVGPTLGPHGPFASNRP